MLVNFRTK